MRAACAVFPVCLALTSPVVANPVGIEIRMVLGIYAEGVLDLSRAGYSEIRMRQWERGRFSAYDENGSEVILVLNSDTGAVVSETYVHHADR